MPQEMGLFATFRTVHHLRMSMLFLQLSGSQSTAQEPDEVCLYRPCTSGDQVNER